MLYKQFLETIVRCPFCYPKDRIFKNTGTAYLTYAIAPYSHYHLLVIPKRHVVSFDKLTAREEKDIASLLAVGARAMRRLKINDYTVLVRNGDKRIKSVPHLHYHVIPRHRIGDLDAKGRRRKVLDTKEKDRLTKKIAKVLKG